MLDPEDVDLVKALSRLSKLAVRLAENVAREFADEQRALEIADVLDDTSRLVRLRLISRPPRVIEQGDPDDDPANPDHLTTDDRLAAGLTVNAYQQTLAAQEIRRGLMDQGERDDLADALVELARTLRYGTNDFGDSGSR